MSKKDILVVNKGFFPLRVESMEKVFNGIFRQEGENGLLGLDIHYAEDEEGNLDKSEISYWNVIKSAEEWCALDVRPYDEYIGTARGPVRRPTVVVCADFNKILYPKVSFPTRQNIFKRDNFTCCYTGEKLSKKDLSIDHVFPQSRCKEKGINPNTWENMVTCHKEKNSIKGDRTPGEMGWSMKYKPRKPKDGLVFELVKEDWAGFIKHFS